MHGTILVFMVLTTAPLGGFGNYFLPIQIGAEDMAFPRLNMLSFWLTFASFMTLMAAFFVTEGGVNVYGPTAGWTGYPPLSAVPQAGHVFGGTKVRSVRQVIRNWNRIKAQEKHGRG